MKSDAERSARIAAWTERARPIWETTGDTDALQRFLKDNDCHGIEAVRVTMAVLNCDLTEAQRAFLGAPCRDTERRFHDEALKLLERAEEAPMQHTAPSQVGLGPGKGALWRSPPTAANSSGAVR
ncbi:hypothetical protein [Streptomyces neyagawaensis]|uniref:hypothetical protein n=1 Tax=Streptomyces neyagawaensis TaxID=42238 RepID=UPI0006E2E034|nr:hypothetical protein [Streptomyces neyagawaensis]MCL6735232.1 hypothetical protein [Streptomyces neyagawaensis]MDE1683867.1 hypothetical protein [Streptomyces neyagawaensis]